MKDVRSFLGHLGLYREFIQDFSKIAKPLMNFFAKDMPFHFYEECSKAFNRLKETLTSAPILHSPIWGERFELICDASDYDVQVVLGQYVDTKPHVIHNESFFE